MTTIQPHSASAPVTSPRPQPRPEKPAAPAPAPDLSGILPEMGLGDLSTVTPGGPPKYDFNQPDLSFDEPMTPSDLKDQVEAVLGEDLTKALIVGAAIKKVADGGTVDIPLFERNW